MRSVRKYSKDTAHGNSYSTTTDTGEEKRKLVTALGAEKWVDFRESQNLVQDVMVAAGGKGPHAAIVVSGVVRLLAMPVPFSITLTLVQAEPFNQAIMYLRANGTLVAVGMGNCVLEAPIPIVIAKVCHHLRTSAVA